MQLPQELIDKLKHTAGFDSDKFIAAHELNPSISIRLNSKKNQSEEIVEYTNVPWLNEGKYIKNKARFSLDPLWHAGTYYVQEASSMIVGCIIKQLIPKEKTINALDFCAAPGGKTTCIADNINENSFLVSNEVNTKRISSLKENVVKWGSGNIAISNSSVDKFSEIEEFFDLILIDAPCSGSGMFRKDEFALKQWSQNLVNSCVDAQKEIILGLMNSLSKEGILIYSTCSFSREENEAICDFILENEELENVVISVAKEWNITETLSDKHKAIGYRFWPYNLEGEGFFVSVFRKKGSKEIKEIKSKNIPIYKPSLLMESWLKENLKFNFEPFYTLHKETVGVENSNLSIKMNLLKKYIYFVYSGTDIAKESYKEIIPQAELAFSTNIKFIGNTIEVDKTKALNFLSKQTQTYKEPKGWYLIKYLNQGLGFIKQLENRCNNYFPSEWRLRDL
jgi:NOL1/NOP2/sun family putative RNA methylase